MDWAVLIAALVLSYFVGRPLVERDFEAILEPGESAPWRFADGLGAFWSSDHEFGFKLRHPQAYRHFGFRFDSKHRQWTDLAEPFQRTSGRPP